MDKNFTHFLQLGYDYAEETIRLPSVLSTGFHLAIDDLVTDSKAEHTKKNKEIEIQEKCINDCENKLKEASTKIIELENDLVDLNKKMSDETINLKKKQDKVDHEVKGIESKIDLLKKEKNTPRGDIENRGNRWDRRLTKVIFWGLTMSLFLFYWSAWYNGLFSNFFYDEIQNNGAAASVFKAVMNPYFIYEAIAESYNFLGLAFALFLTSVPLGVATLLHNNSSYKSLREWNVKPIAAVSLLIALTLDFLLAYKIVEEIYNAKRFLGEVSNEPFSAFKCFSEITFYLIFLISFITYFVWGVFYGRITKDKNNTDVIDLQIYHEIEKMNKLILNKEENDADSTLIMVEFKSNKSQIERKISAKKNELELLDKDIINSKERITSLSKKISLSMIEVKKRVDAFFVGWVKNYSEHTKQKEAKDLKSKVEDFEKYKYDFFKDLEKDDKFYFTDPNE